MSLGLLIFLTHTHLQKYTETHTQAYTEDKSTI